MVYQSVSLQTTILSTLFLASEKKSQPGLLHSILKTDCFSSMSLFQMNAKMNAIEVVVND